MNIIINFFLVLINILCVILFYPDPIVYANIFAAIVCGFNGLRELIN